MPVKPTKSEIDSARIMKSNPNFGHDALEAIINDTDDLKAALIEKGLVEVIQDEES